MTFRSNSAIGVSIKEPMLDPTRYRHGLAAGKTRNITRLPLVLPPISTDRPAHLLDAFGAKSLKVRP